MTKIIIIGGGISGLSSYLFLQKHLLSSPSHAHYDVRIYDPHNITAPSFPGLQHGISGSADIEPGGAKESFTSPTTIGGAIGISKNGLNVVSRLDADLLDSPVKQTLTRGHPVRYWDIETARGFKIASINTSATKHVDSLGNTASDTSTMGMIARQVFIEILYDHFKQVAPTMDILQHKKVFEVVVGDDETPNIVKFEDGSQEEADLVIGADGLRSVVRKAMFASYEPKDAHNHESPSWFRSWIEWLSFGKVKHQDKKVKCDYVTPHYEGLVGLGGFVPSSILESTGHKPGSMAVVFGPNGFFGYGYVTSDTDQWGETPPEAAQRRSLAGWWSTFSSKDPYPFHKLAEDTQGRRDANSGNRVFDPILALTSLVSRHSTWKNSSVSAVVRYVQQSYEDYHRPLKSATSSENTPGTRMETDPSSSFGLLQTSYATYTTPELPHWHIGGRAILIGDAAHALQPSSGQGASQALEDAETLALVLAHYLSPTSDPGRPSYPYKAAEKALATFETIRKPRVHTIYEYSQRMSQMKSDMSFVMEWIMYFMIWVMSSSNQSYNDDLLEYDLPSVVRETIGSIEKAG